VSSEFLLGEREWRSYVVSREYPCIWSRPWWGTINFFFIFFGLLCAVSREAWYVVFQLSKHPGNAIRDSQAQRVYRDRYPTLMHVVKWTRDVAASFGLEKASEDTATKRAVFVEALWRNVREVHSVLEAEQRRLGCERGRGSLCAFPRATRSVPQKLRHVTAFSGRRLSAFRLPGS